MFYPVPGFVLILMPLFVTAAAFSMTRDFAKKAVLFLMNVITEFLGLTLAINFIMLVFEKTVETNKGALLKAVAAEYSFTFAPDD